MKANFKSYILSLLAILLCFSTYGQSKSSRKDRKSKVNDTKTSRLFIEGQKHLMLEDYDKAYFYFQKARELSPEEPAINFKLAEVYLKANKVESALEYGMKAVEADPENKYYNLMMAEVYTKQRQPLKAAAIIENLMSTSEENQNYILDLASLYLNAGENDKALEALDKAEEFYGVAEPLTAQKQRIYLRKNNLAKAIEEGQKLIEAHPGNSQYVLSLVEIYFNNGKTNEALETINNSLKTYPNQPELQMAAYALHKDLGNLETAEELILNAYANPDLDGMIKAQSFAEILQEIKTERRDSLLDQLEALMLESNANDGSVQTVIGDRKLFNGHKAEALEYYKRAIAIKPENPQVFQGVITIMFETAGDFTEIEKYTSMAVDEFPERAEFWFFDGTAKSALKKNEEAEESLLKSLEINENKNKQLTMLVNGQLGDVYHNLGKEEKAFEKYEKVLADNPNDEHVLNNYAYYLSLSKKNLEKAKSMSEKLVKRFPKNATYLDTHAWVLFQMQDYENAKKYMELALENQETPSAIMLEHYGDILYHLGNKNEAIAYWKKAEGGDETTDLLNRKIKDQKYYD
ncbi:tetratricopeptide repeat protein [Belliella kenyensis]|uniref:Tetratricopeptide repeat protein n=1 Tax=Belliella kenyensis TaxID=1472724 RepID=A0ABV8ENB8_9BACT|nr:tetratricopeptide repeat protein [Belliella kenyensis]MCH7400659.1 tetratricopeptide repeat protein [Belliella kenyensis]MDN3602054.1 tetratricopeptide repeat protein [Belliella kenyensis]